MAAKSSFSQDPIYFMKQAAVGTEAWVLPLEEKRVCLDLRSSPPQNIHSGLDPNLRWNLLVGLSVWDKSLLSKQSSRNKTWSKERISLRKYSYKLHLDKLHSDQFGLQQESYMDGATLSSPCSRYDMCLKLKKENSWVEGTVLSIVEGKLKTPLNTWDCSVLEGGGG